MKLKECFEKRLLRKEKPDLEKSKISLNIAKERLKDAKIAIDSKLFESVIVLSYTSMFHAARAILFKDGVIEKSHACLVSYLREEYANKGLINPRYIHILNTMRFERHEVLYGLEIKSKKEDAQHALKNAQEFLDFVSKFLNI